MTLDLYSNRKFVLSLAWSTLFYPSLGFSNDSVAGFENNELVLKNSKEIRMDSELLEISQDKIKIEYQFYNESSKPIATEVAFPLPAVSMFPEQDESPVTNFQVTIEGQKITPTKTFKLSNGCKRSAAEINATKDATLKEILKDGKTFSESEIENTRKKLLAVNDENIMCIMQQEILHWPQVFPVGALRSTHEYTPSVASYWGDTKKISADTKKYCIDKGTASAIKKLNKESEYVSYRTISYVLMTARNWKGPIKNFKLRITKPSEKSVLSVCMNGLKKVDKTMFEVEKKDFLPPHDLNILFVTKQK